MTKAKTSIPFFPPEELSIDSIRNQLQRILASSEFTATESQRKFLDFVVLQTLAGYSSEIKGFTVATCVFGRGDDFDQANDPIVSIQANKLRRALERYYLVAGQNDSVHIDIPKGTYVPVFTEHSPSTPVVESRVNRERCTLTDESWPTILIRPFLNLTGDNSFNWLGAGFASELRMVMTKIRDILIINGHRDEGVKRSVDTVARFVLDGEILNDMEGLKVIVTLTDTSSNLQLWSKGLNCGINPSQLVTFQKEIVQIVASQIGCENGVIANTILKDSIGKAPEQLNTYEAILRFLQYMQAPTEEGFIQALYGLEHAKKNEPLCSTVWSMLARLYIIIYSFEINGFVHGDAKRKAIICAEKGVQLAPDSQFTHTILAFIRLVTGETVAAQKEARLAYELYPESIVLLDAIGYVMTLSGDWGQGTTLIRKSIQRNPYYGDYVHHALWVNWVKQENLEQAYQETLSFRNPNIFWEPLLKASTLGHLGRADEGRLFAQDLLALKPDFPSRGRILIGRFVKHSNVADLIAGGLKKCGLVFD
ncbi:hypothetical protein [Desulforhopalus sp. 52FAK]